MSIKFWEKLNWIIGIIVLGCLFGLLVVMANIEIKDLDIWLHLGMGQFIWQNGYVPGYDILSCFVQGAPWNNHEWLFQIIVHLLYTNFGPDGLITMQVGLVGITMLVLMLLGYDRNKQFLVAFTLLLVLLVYQVRFTFRPDLFSLLFFALYIFVLSIFIDKRWSTYALVVIQLLWTNMHGFFFFGPLFVLMGLAAEWLKRHVKLPWEWNKVGRLTDEEYHRLGKILIFVTLVCLVNPLGVEGAIYPVKVFFQLSGESQIFFKYITELQRPVVSFVDFWHLQKFFNYKFLIIMSVFSFVFNRRRIDISSIFVWLVFLGFSLKAVRNIPFFAFAAYLAIITNSVNLTLKDIVPIRFQNKKFKFMTAVMFKILMVLWMLDIATEVSMRGYFDFEKYQRKSERMGVAQRGFPDKAVQFLVTNEVKGNILNDFNSGAYLVGHCFPNIKVFIDGRTEVYGPANFKLYRSMYEGADSKLLDEMLPNLNVTIALLNSSSHMIPAKLVKYFYNHQDWVAVYFDYDGLIFLKDVEQHKELIKKYAVNLEKWEPKKIDLMRLRDRIVTPFQNVNRAFTLQSLELYDQAMAEAHEAIKVNPTYHDPYKIIGKIYGLRGEYEKAFEHFRIAGMLKSGDRKNRFNLAQSYYDLKEYNNAVYQYNRLMRENSGDPKPRFLIARVYTQMSEYDQAIDYIKQGHKLKPDNIMDLLKLGEILYEAEEYEGAAEVYEMGLNTNKEHIKLHNRLGLVHQAMGDYDAALAAFEKGLAIDPKNEEIKKNLSKLLKQRNTKM